MNFVSRPGWEPESQPCLHLHGQMSTSNHKYLNSIMSTLQKFTETTGTSESALLYKRFQFDLDSSIEPKLQFSGFQRRKQEVSEGREKCNGYNSYIMVPLYLGISSCFKVLCSVEPRSEPKAGALCALRFSFTAVPVPRCTIQTA